MSEFGLTNIMAAPKVSKININMGVKEMAHDKGLIDKVSSQLVALLVKNLKLQGPRSYCQF